VSNPAKGNAKLTNTMTTKLIISKLTLPKLAVSRLVYFDVFYIFLYYKTSVKIQILKEPPYCHAGDIELQMFLFPLKHIQSVSKSHRYHHAKLPNPLKDAVLFCRRSAFQLNEGLYSKCAPHIS
jgi:hypothetical protein